MIHVVRMETKVSATEMPHITLELVTSQNDFVKFFEGLGAGMPITNGESPILNNLDLLLNNGDKLEAMVALLK
jgi:hypothetical protein